MRGYYQSRSAGHAHIAQTLAWYEAGLRGGCSLCNRDARTDQESESISRIPHLQGHGDAKRNRASSSTDSGTSSHKSANSSYGTSVWLSPIRIGTMELDALHKERVVGPITLVELYKMGKVEEAFTNKFCVTGNGKYSMQGDGGEPPQPLHFTLEMLLQGLLKRLEIVAKERLNRELE